MMDGFVCDSALSVQATLSCIADSLVRMQDGLDVERLDRDNGDYSMMQLLHLEKQMQKLRVQFVNLRSRLLDRPPMSHEGA